MADRSKTDICNLALFEIGHTKTIDDVDTERSLEAVVCRNLFDQSLDEVLEAGTWPPRRARPAQLDATTLDLGEVPGGWTYAYALPSDCVPNGLRRIYPGVRNPRSDQETPHAIEWDGATGQFVVLTDDDAPEFLYTPRVTTTAKYAASFARAVAEQLAVYLVPALRKDLKLVPIQEAKAAQAIGKALASTRRGEKPDEDPPPSWIANR
jgi:hypothetical protein